MLTHPKVESIKPTKVRRKTLPILLIIVLFSFAVILTFRVNIL